MRLTNADLAEIKKRADTATKGPWYTGEGYEQSNRGNYVASKANGGIIAAEQDGTDCVLDTNDATFIAHARQDVPALLAEVERLRTIQKRLVAELKKADVYSEELERQYYAATLPVVIEEFVAKKRSERDA
jgi:hypothetical protein